MLCPCERNCTFYFINIRCVLILQFSASRVNVVGIRMSTLQAGRPRNRGLMPAGVIDFFLFQGLQVVSGADPASCLVGTWSSFRGVNRPGREVDRSPQSSPELKND